MLRTFAPLAVARVCLGIATGINAVEMYVLLGNVADGAFAMPIVSWWPSPSHFWVSLYLVLTMLASVAIAAGFRVTWASLVATFLNCLVFLADQQTYSNHRWLALILVALLALAYTPIRRRDEAGGIEASTPSWPVLLMMTQLSVCYLFAAVSKVNPAFLSGEPLTGWVRWDLPLWSTMLMALGTVATELFLAFGLWFRRTRRVAVGVGLLLHGSIVVMMSQDTVALVAFSLTCVGLYPLFLSLGQQAIASEGRHGPTRLDSFR